MSRRIRALFVLCVLSICLVFATACQSSGPKVKEVSLGGGLPTVTFDCDYAKSKKTIQVPSLEGWSAIETYSPADSSEKVGSCTISTYDNPQSVSLAEITETIGKSNNVCFDMLEYEGTPCGYLADYSLEDNKYYRTWIFENNGKFKAFTFCDETKEIKIGSSNYYLRVPVSYEQTDNDTSKSGVVGTYKDANGHLVQFTIKKPEVSNRSYEDAVERNSGDGEVYPITKEQYETFAQNGWKAKDRRDYFDLKRGIVDEKIFTVPQTESMAYAFEYITYEDGTKISNIVVAVDTDDGEYEIVFKKIEAKDWTSQGGAFGKSICYKKK